MKPEMFAGGVGAPIVGKVPLIVSGVMAPGPTGVVPVTGPVMGAAGTPGIPGTADPT
jgi:hypothetical protein